MLDSDSPVVACPENRPGPGRPKDASKRAAILKAARKHFLQFGYNGASMDAVAAEAGVSKLTIYSHFNCKDDLFQEVVRGECMINSLDKDYEAIAKLSPEEALREVGHRILKVVLHADMVNLHRLMVAQAAQAPKISRLFYEAGPEPGKDAFAGLLASIAMRGVHAFEDPKHATQVFCAMVKGDMHYQAVLNLQTRPSTGEMEEHINRCVRLFLKAYAV